MVARVVLLIAAQVIAAQPESRQHSRLARVPDSPLVDDSPVVPSLAQRIAKSSVPSSKGPPKQPLRALAGIDDPSTTQGRAM
jgi:hypothetical protein